jgi:hypothetical protein
MLKRVAAGEKPACSEVLVFMMRRLRGENAQKAWAALDGISDEQEKGSWFHQLALPPIR